MSDAPSVSTSIGGACLCGAVAFAIAPPYRWFAHCHCSMCRKHHGSLFGTSLGVARAAFRWLEGTDEIVHYRATAAFERPFCRHCGSTVPAASHDERYWTVPAGLLEGDPGARPRTHIFVASRSPLVELDSILPQHAAYPPTIALPTVATRRAHDESAAVGRNLPPALAALPPSLAVCRKVAPALAALPPSLAVAGSCLCGAVAFTASALPRRVVNCYCSLCRRSRAAAFSSTLLVSRETFRFDRGETSVRRYKLPTRQYGTDFCGECGSPVPRVGADAAMLPSGAIDSPLPPLPAVHLYVGSKAPWYEISDSWPQFDELAPPEQLTEVFR